MLHARDDYNERVQDSESRIPDDEPVVLLRGQDELACMAVEYYAMLCRQFQSKDVARMMRGHAALMREWPVKKIPDVPAHLVK